MNPSIEKELKRFMQDQNRTYMYIIYALFALAVIFKPLAIFGAVFAFVKRDELPPNYQAHCSYLIKTFIVAFIAIFAAVISLIFWLVFAWYIYRVVNGFNKLHNGREIDGTSWLQ